MKMVEAMETSMANTRNHVAKALWSGKFRSQTIKSKKAYTRKVKHKNSCR